MDGWSTPAAKATEVQACLAAGAVSKALRQLEPATAVAPDADAIRELPGLFPPRAVEIPPSDAEPREDDVQNCIGEFAKGVGGAPRRPGAGCPRAHPRPHNAVGMARMRAAPPGRAA